MSDRNPRGIFLQGIIAAMLQAVFDTAIAAWQSLLAVVGGFLGGEAGQAIDHLAGFALGVPQFPFEAEGLGDLGPIQIVV